MADQESGDKEFEKFINDNTGSPTCNLPMIVRGIRDKMDFIRSMFELSLTSYRCLDEKDPLKKPLMDYIKKLSDSSEKCMDQSDMVLLDYENAELRNIDDEPLTGGGSNEEAGSDDDDPLKELGL